MGLFNRRRRDEESPDDSSSSRPFRASRSAQPPLVEDPITKVGRLAELLEDGALTREEFQEQKRKALDEG